MATQQVNQLALVPPPSILDEVKLNFGQWETYRRQNHDPRYLVSDQLYTAWQPQKVWEGTRIARSSIGTFTTMESVETMLAHVMGTIFPLDDNIITEAKFGTSAEQARLAFMLIREQLNEQGDLREILRLAFKQGFLYGNGIVELYWMYQQTEKTIALPVWDFPNPLMAAFYGASPERRIAVHKIPFTINRPCLRHVDIRDFFMDPHCPGPDIQKSRGYFIREMPTIDDILAYRETEGFNVPDENTLRRFARQTPSASSDIARQQSEAYRATGYAPTNQYTDTPGLQRLELLRYYKHDRIVWTLNREHILYDTPNYFDCLPALNAFYIDYPGRFYGISIADVVEPEQRLQTAIINARVDELALLIHSPFIKRRGDSVPQGQMRLVPGRTIELDYPQDFKKLEWGNATAESYAEVAASERRSQKTTGITDMASLGTPAAGGNSANRTATGINSQIMATGRRIGYIINNLESNTIEPLFEMCHKFNQMFLHDSQVMYFTGLDSPVPPQLIKHAQIRFRCTGGRKSQARAMLLQVLPQLLPMLLNPAILQQQAQLGQTVDWQAIFGDIADALNIPPTQWWKAMTPDQMQQYQMFNPNVMGVLQQGQRLDAMKEMSGGRDDASLMKPVFGELAKSPEVQQAMTGIKVKPKEPGKSNGSGKSAKR